MGEHNMERPWLVLGAGYGLNEPRYWSILNAVRFTDKCFYTKIEGRAKERRHDQSEVKAAFTTEDEAREAIKRAAAEWGRRFERVDALERAAREARTALRDAETERRDAAFAALLPPLGMNAAGEG